MSLVEKALKKLQDSRASEAVVEPIRPDVLLGSAPAAPQSARSDKQIVLNYPGLRLSGLVAPEGHERRLSREYREIKRPLIAAAFGKGVPRLPNGRMIMIASALPGEGKSFTSVNLALSMALEKNISVVLVDADVPKPHLSRAFGVADEPGLLDALREESRDVESLIVPTNQRGLSLLPVGTHVETATELLASSRMEQIVASLGHRDPNRIVLFDSPPLLLTSESRALAASMGQIVIVVRAESTLRQAVYDAIGCVGEGKSVGLILNQSESAPANVYYGYGEYGEKPNTQPQD